MLCLQWAARPVAMVPLRITFPIEIRILAIHHPLTIRRQIAAFAAVASLVIANQPVAAELPPVIFLVPMPLLPLVPLIATVTAPLPFFVFPSIPPAALPLIPLIVILLVVQSRSEMTVIMFVLGDLKTRLRRSCSDHITRRQSEPSDQRQGCPSK